MGGPCGGLPDFQSWKALPPRWAAGAPLGALDGRGWPWGVACVEAGGRLNQRGTRRGSARSRRGAVAPRLQHAQWAHGPALSSWGEPCRAHGGTMAGVTGWLGLSGRAGPKPTPSQAQIACGGATVGTEACCGAAVRTKACVGATVGTVGPLCVAWAPRKRRRLSRQRSAGLDSHAARRWAAGGVAARAGGGAACRPRTSRRPLT